MPPDCLFPTLPIAVVGITFAACVVFWWRSRGAEAVSWEESEECAWGVWPEEGN